MTLILIVEDSPVQCRLLTAVLESAGFETCTAATRAEGLTRAIAEPLPDLVIADLLLPDGTGLDVCRSLREQPLRKYIPLILHTSLGTAHDVMQGLAAGADGYMVKELPPDEMINRVNRLLADCGDKRPNEHSEDSEIEVRFLGQDYRLHASREQLVNVVVSALEDLAQAGERHEAELARRREAEQRLRDSEALYESLVDSLPLNLFRKDLNGSLTFTNRRYCEAQGTTQEEMLGKTDYDMFPKELADKYTSDDRRVLESRSVFEDTESHMTPSGDKAYVHVLKTPVYDADSNVIGIQGIFWDVTARKLAEQALDHERILLTSLLDSIPDNIFFKDREHRYLRVNRAMASRLGLEHAGDATGKTAADFFDDAYSAEILADDQHICSTGQPIVGREQEILWPDGSRKWVLLTRMPIRDDDGNIKGSFGVSHDITDQKDAQEAMRLARDAAEAASDSKSNFLANMSHEIRTPMNAIIGMTELVLDTELTTSQRDYLLMVQESGESLLGIINDILDFSKIEADRLELMARPFALREEIGDTLKSLAIRLRERSVEIATHFAADVPEFLIGDSGRLRQIIVNLVGNSIKFTESGEIVLDVSLSDDATTAVDGSVMLHFAVRDTGIGIPEDKLQRIFGAFEQVDMTMTRRYEGTGLGLAISSRLVQMMCGRMWVESELGRWSTFHFTAEFDEAPESITRRQQSDVSLEGRRILVVDDNATNRLILEEILRNWLVQPILVDGAMAAIAAIEDADETGDSFDMILTDATMPDVDGFSLIEQLRSRSDLSIPVIMMLTSSGRIGDVARCSELGIQTYLMKPVKQSELFDAIVESLDVTSAVDADSDHGEGPLRHSQCLSVLLAEDSDVNQKLAIALLEKWGHEVTVAVNGRIAVDMNDRESFDVILMDIQMPEMDGLEATRVIREQETAAGHIPIIAMTAHALKGDEERCLAAGMDAYISKPIRAPLLFDRLTELCNLTAVPGVVTGQDTISTETAGVVDWDKALEITAGDSDLLREIVEAVLEECPAQLARLEQSISEGDAPTARRCAHTILGNFRTLSANGPMGCAGDVERLAKDARLGELSEPMSQLRAAVAAVMADAHNFSSTD